MRTPGTARVLVGSALLVLAGALAAPCPRTITGRVTGLAGDTLAVRTKPGATVEVKLVAATRYLKWITRKPWQQSTRARRSFLGVGKVVAVETATGEASCEARVVRIATE